jgi:hypothetical protein
MLKLWCCRCEAEALVLHLMKEFLIIVAPPHPQPLFLVVGVAPPHSQLFFFWFLIDFFGGLKLAVCLMHMVGIICSHSHHIA